VFYHIFHLFSDSITTTQQQHTQTNHNIMGTAEGVNPNIATKTTKQDEQQ